MKLTQKQKEALDWLEKIQSKTEDDITLRYINDYWRVCPMIVNKDRKFGEVHLGKVNMKVWNSLIEKGYFEKEKSEMNDEGFIYIYNRQR